MANALWPCQISSYRGGGGLDLAGKALRVSFQTQIRKIQKKNLMHQNYSYRTVYMRARDRQSTWKNTVDITWYPNNGNKSARQERLHREHAQNAKEPRFTSPGLPVNAQVEDDMTDCSLTSCPPTRLGAGAGGVVPSGAPALDFLKPASLPLPEQTPEFRPLPSRLPAHSGHALQPAIGEKRRCSRWATSEATRPSVARETRTPWGIARIPQCTCFAKVRQLSE